MPKKTVSQLLIIASLVLVMASLEIFCSLCTHSSTNLDDATTHYVKFHKHSPGFKVSCSVEKCAYTANTWGAFRAHLCRKHPGILKQNQGDEQMRGNDDDQDQQDEQQPQHEIHTEDLDPHYSNMVFTLSLQAEHGLSQSAIDCVVSAADDLVSHHVDSFRKQVKRKLEERGIDTGVCDELSGTETFLSDFDSHAKRQKIFRDRLKTFVAPQKICLGHKWVTVKGRLQSVPCFGFYVPLKENLENLLSMPEVLNLWTNPVHSVNDDPDGFMHDVCHGAYVRNHELFCRNKQALQIIFSCDDVEVVNPIGTHVKKNKVTVMYFTLGNIPPPFRSQLKVIQLVAIAKSTDMKKNGAPNRLLSDFLTTVSALEEGLEMSIGDTNQVVMGSLVFVSADTLAANWIGGMKEGVAFALKNCRTCDLQSHRISTDFVESSIIRRSSNSHRERCAVLSDPALTKNARAYWSKLWGINSASCLLRINQFEFVSGLIHDPMHVILEGVALHDLKHTLLHLIDIQKYFSLAYLNTVISGFSYSYLHAQAKPAPIERQHLSEKGSIKQTASGMLTLLQTLPVMLAHKVNGTDRNWINFLRLVQITNICTSTYCSKDTATWLQILTAEYLHNFQLLYPKASFIPKMHYLIHLPTQMKQYGPLRHTWCMRFEGKNAFLKTKKYKNFKNLPLTLVNKHQIHMAYKQSGTDKGRNLNYLNEGDTVRPGMQVKFSVLYPELLQKKTTVVPGAEDDVYVTTSVTIHGKEYRKGCAIVLEYSDDDEPTFAFLDNVVVIDQVKYFVLECMDAYYHAPILSYICEPTGAVDFVSYVSLQFKWPLSVYKHKGKCAVMNCNSHTCVF